MEAATPLPFSQVRLVGDSLRVDGLVVTDECAVRLAAEQDDLHRFALDAIEIGARVLDREQTGAAAELVKAEMEQATRRFTEHAARLAERMDEKVNSVFVADDGALARVMARHFGDESNVAVQHRIKAVLTEVAGQMREDMRKQLTADSEENPIVAIQRASLKVVRDNAAEQAQHLRLMAEKLEAMKAEVAGLRAEKEKLEEVDAERERGTAKGRDFEEEVAAAIDAIALAQGDDSEAVGDVKEAIGKVGDVVVGIDACNGPARGRIVFEAKNKKLSRPEALRELDRAREERNADFAVLVVSGEGKVPAKMLPLREYNGDKMVVTYDPEDGSSLALQVAYSLARARVLLRRADGDGIDAEAIRATSERAVQSLGEVQRIKQQLTASKTAVDKAAEIVDGMASAVKANLAEIQAIVAAASPALDAAALPGALDAAVEPRASEAA
jgi:hypothetical protein